MDEQNPRRRNGNLRAIVGDAFPPGAVYVFSDQGFTVLYKGSDGRITTPDCSLTAVDGDIGVAVEKVLAGTGTAGVVTSSDKVIGYLGATGRFVPDDELRVGVVYEYRRGRQEGGWGDLEWAFVAL